MSVLNLSQYRFLPDRSLDGSINPRGDGTVLVDLAAAGYDLAGRRSISVVDRSGRSVVYSGGGPTYFADSDAGTEEFAGWSYFEEEATEDLDGACVQLFVLSPGYDVADYPGVS